MARPKNPQPIDGNEQLKSTSEAIFGNTSALQQNVQMITRGLLPNIPAEIVIRAIKRKDRKKVLMTDVDDILLALLQESIVSPSDFNVYNLYPFESMYLLYRLRVLTYGGEHTWHQSCPYCGKDNEIEISLDDIPIVPVPDDFKPVFDITLPASGVILTCKLLTEGEIINIRKKANELTNRTGNQSAYLDLVWEQRIVAINGNKDVAPIQKTQFLDDLIDYDSEYLIQAYDANIGNYGLQTGITTTCDHCNREIKTEVPSIYTFFRPTIKIDSTI